MKVIWSAWAIVIGAIGAPEIGASTYTKDPRAARGLEFLGGGMVARKKMLRNERDLSGQSRIVGGQDADIGKYPFFVEWDGCGASLIHKGKYRENPSRNCKSVLPAGLINDSQLAHLYIFHHIQTLLCQRLIVLKSHQTSFMSDRPVDLPSLLLQAVVNRDLSPNAYPIHPIAPAQLISTISS
jgi:hypothetical protein